MSDHWYLLLLVISWQDPTQSSLQSLEGSLTRSICLAQPSGQERRLCGRYKSV